MDLTLPADQHWYNVAQVIHWPTNLYIQCTCLSPLAICIRTILSTATSPLPPSSSNTTEQSRLDQVLDHMTLYVYTMHSTHA